MRKYKWHNCPKCHRSLLLWFYRQTNIARYRVILAFPSSSKSISFFLVNSSGTLYSTHLTLFFSIVSFKFFSCSFSLEFPDLTSTNTTSSIFFESAPLNTMKSIGFPINLHSVGKYLKSGKYGANCSENCPPRTDRDLKIASFLNPGINSFSHSLCLFKAPFLCPIR